LSKTQNEIDLISAENLAQKKKIADRSTILFVLQSAIFFQEKILKPVTQVTGFELLSRS